MAMSVVGYPEYDIHNRVPIYCSKCRRELIDMTGVEEYDIYTGVPKDATYRACPTRIDWHDHWRLEGHGAWVNHATSG